MANPFYSVLSGNQPNIQQMLGQLKANPMQFLMQRRFNVPQDMMKDPNAIVQHLLSTGQVNQQQINQAYQMAHRFGMK